MVNSGAGRAHGSASTTQRNRRLIGEHRNVFRARFPGSGRAWLAALADPATAMPDQPALLWVSVSGGRLYPARLG